MNFEENIKRFNRALARYAFYVIRWIISKLPYSVYKFVANFFVTLGRPLLNKKKKIAIENLYTALGDEYSGEEIKNLYKKIYKNFSRGMIDLIYLIDRPKAVGEKVTMEGKEILDDVLKEGKGAIFVSAHFGNFILMYVKMVQEGYKTNVIMRRVRDEKWEKQLSDLRAQLGVRAIYDLPPRKCVQECIRALRNNEVLFILLDQNYGGEGRIFVEFFGEQAATATGPVVFSNRTGAPILPIFIMHDGDDRHKLVINPPIALDHYDDDQEMILMNIKKITKIIEDRVRERPYEWGGWMHKRWKSRTLEEQRILDLLNEMESPKTQQRFYLPHHSFDLKE